MGTWDQPDIPEEELSFEHLFDLDDIQILQDEFAEATGVASIITHPDGTPITKPSNFCRLCSEIIRKTEKGCANCYRSDAALGKLCITGPTIQPCMSGGLWDAGAGISVGGKHIANWLIGQVRDETQTTDMIRLYAREIGADENEAEEAFELVTSMSQEQFKKISKALFTLANQLSRSAYQNLQMSRSIIKRQIAEEALRQNEERFRNVFNATHDALFLHDENGRILDVNDTMLKMYGLTKEEALRSSILGDLTSPSNKVKKLDELWAGVIDGLHTEMDWLARRPHDGSEFQAQVNLQRVFVGNTPRILAVVRDVSEREKAEEERSKLEAQLRHSQKMDAIGQLAGGVAHDFNNMLGGIMGATELLKKYLPDTDKARKLHRVIMESAERAADLTQKLLTFSRREIRAPSTTRIHETINSTVDLLERTIDRRIGIETILSSEDDAVLADSSQLQSAFLNLGINAAQAMVGGGTLTISTSIVQLDLAHCQQSPFELEPGRFLQIEFRDSGHGISPETLNRIFEPFFTTKKVGEGTGLGLAAVYGTILQHNGAISVYSEVGVGTSFQMLLPLVEDDTSVRADAPEVIRGTGHILVVDDEPVLRLTAEAILEELGYQVTLASDGQEALDLFRESPELYDLVVLDMIMPELNGRDCFDAMRGIKPDVRVVLASGFAREEDTSQMTADGLLGFIRKPFRAAELSQAVHRALR